MGVLVAALVVLVAGLVALALVALSTPAARQWVRGELETVLSSALGDAVDIVAVSSLSPAGIALEEVSVGGEEPTLHVPSLFVELSLPSVFPPRLAADVVLVEPSLDLRRDAGGTWNVERWAGEDDPGAPDEEVSLPRWLAQVDVEVRDGEVLVEGLAPRPLQVRALALTGRLWVGLLRDAVVEVDSLRADLGDRSRLDLHGTWELEGDERLAAELRLRPLVGADLGGLVAELRDDARVAGTVEAEGTTDRLRVELDLQSGEARLAGTVEPAPEPGEGVTASFDAKALDPARLLVDAPDGPVNAAGELAVRLEGDELRAVDGTVTFTDSRLFDVEVESLALEADTADGEVRLRADGTTPEGGVRVALEGGVALAAPHRAAASGRVELHDPAGLGEAVQEYLAGSDLVASVDAEVDDPLADVPTGSLALTVEPGRLRGVPVDGAELSVRLEPELLRVDRLRLRAADTSLDGWAWAQLPAAGSAPADGRGIPVGGELHGPLGLALLTDAAGVVQTDVEVWGRTDDLGGVAVLTSEGPIAVADLEAELSARLDAAHLGGEGGRAELDLTGTVDPDGAIGRWFGREARALGVRAGWTRTPGTRDVPAADRVRVDGTFGEPGPGSVDLAAVLESAAGRTTVRLEELSAQPVVGPAWVLAEPAVVEAREDEIRIGDVLLEVGAGRIEARGRLAGEAGPGNDFQVRVSDVDLALVCELVVLGDDCAGRLEAALEVTGAAARPDVAFDATLDDLRVANQGYGALVARARNRGDVLAVAARLEGGPGGALRLDGELPLEAGGRMPVVSMQRPARVELRAEDLEVDALRAFIGRSVRRLDGDATLRVTLTGPLADPALDGDLRVTNLVFAAAATGATHRDGRVHLTIDPTRFSLDELTLDDDAITAGGTVRLDAGLPTEFDLWLALDQADVVARPEADVSASGRVALTGPVGAPHAAGEIVVDRATIRPNVAPGGGAREPDASIVVVRAGDEKEPWISGVPPALGGEVAPRPGGSEAADLVPPAEAPDFYRDLSMMVTVRIGDQVRVRRYDANLRLYGEVYLTKEPADPLRISGGIGGRQGWYVFQGRRFEIDSAYLTFTGETPLDPYLDVEAQYRAGNYLVRIRITGTAKNPSLDLSSDPPLDESDILAVILFGKPASQLNDAQGQVLQSQAFALLASYVAPELQRSVLDTFGLTSLTFSMPTGDTAGTIGVGRYFGDDVFVSVARDFGGPSGGTNRQLQGLVGSSVTIQYYFTPQVTLQGASSTEGESSVDVIWHRRY